MRRRASALISMRRCEEKLEYATERDGQPPQSRDGLWHPQNATIQLQAAFLKARGGAPSVLPCKEPNCDGYLKRRA